MRLNNVARHAICKVIILTKTPAIVTLVKKVPICCILFELKYVGYYGNSGTAKDNYCDGACPRGFYCPGNLKLGTTNPIPCPAGKYGTAEGLYEDSCSGFCSAGYFGTNDGLKTAQCDGKCTAGYYCPEGSKNPKAIKCPAGLFQYFKRSLLLGYFCPEGSTTGLQNPCPLGIFLLCNIIQVVGKYCPQGSAVAVSCPAGKYGNTQKLIDPSCSGSCLPGIFY